MLINVTTKNNRHFVIKNEDLVDYDYKCNSTSSNDFELGGAIPRSFDFTIFDHNFKQYQFYGARIVVYTGDEAIAAHKLGEFTINKTNIEQDIITLESDDDLSNTDIKWVGRGFPCTIWEIITSVCNQCNIQLLNTSAELPNASVIVDNSSNLQSVTCRDILKWSAEANGMFCIMNKNNQLIFKKYDFSSVTILNHNDIDSLKLEQVNTTRKGITIKDRHFGDMAYPIKIEENPILDNLSDANLTIACNRIVNQIKLIDYYAGSFNLWNDDYNPEVGDILQVIDDDGDTFLTIIHDITMNNEDEYFEINSYGDSIEDKNKKKNDTEDSGGDTSGNSKSGGEGNLQMGRIRNHQRIHAMAGRFIILEMGVKNTNYFTKVNLELSVNFIYTNGKFINFDIYANGKFIRRVPIMGTGRLYHAVEAFIADVDYDATSCMYSVVVDINDNEELTIEPFEAILSLKATNGTIEDNAATDQLFIEKFNKITANVLNQNKATTKDLSDSYSIVMGDEPPVLEFTWNISKTGKENLIGEYYSNRELIITGDSGIESAKTNALTRLYNQDSSKFLKILNNARKITFEVNSSDNYSGMFDATKSSGGYSHKFASLTQVDYSQISDDYNISAYMFRGQDTIKSVTASPTIVGDCAFENCTSLENITTLQNTEEIHAFAFENCTSLETAALTNCKEIDARAFMNCTSLEYVNVDSLEILDNTYGYETTGGIFYNCTNLVTVANLEKSNCKVIPNNCFKNCEKLETIDTSKLEEIYDNAFENCTSLEYVDISALKFPTDNAETTMGPHLHKAVFKNCYNLKYCKLGEHLPSTNESQYEPIFIDTFKNCTVMNSVIIYGYYEFTNASGRIDNSCFADTVVDTILLRHLVDRFHPNYSGEQPYFGAFRDCLNRFKTIAMNTNSLPTIYLCAEDTQDENVVQEATSGHKAIRVKDLFEEFIGELVMSGYTVQTFTASSEATLVDNLVNREVTI